MITYLLRDVDRILWRKFRTACTRDGRTLRAQLIRLIEAYVNGGK